MNTLANHPEACGAILAALLGGGGFIWLSFRWAAAPTSDPHDAPHGDVPNVPLARFNRLVSDEGGRPIDAVVTRIELSGRVR